MGGSLFVFRREVEVYQIAAESTGFPCSHGQADCHPDSSENQCLRAQVQPQNTADQETKNWREKVEQGLFLTVQEVTDKCRRVHSHEGDQCSKVQQVRA